jgi:hypothetical protein
MDDRAAAQCLTRAPAQQVLPQDGAGLLQHMLTPCTTADFFSSVWERRALHISRPLCPTFFASWHSRAAIDKLLRTQQLEYCLNLDVTKYDGQVGALSCS